MHSVQCSQWQSSSERQRTGQLQPIVASTLWVSVAGLVFIDYYNTRYIHFTSNMRTTSSGCLFTGRSQWGEVQGPPSYATGRSCRFSTSMLVIKYQCQCFHMHRRRSGWNSEGDAWRAPKVGRCRMGWGMVRVALFSRLGGLGSVMSSPSGVRAEPRPKTDYGVFWRPQNAPFCIYMTKIWGGQFALASPTPNSGGLVPRPPWSTPMSTWTVSCSSTLA